MEVLLGIDAAWTETEPSGLALIRKNKDEAPSCLAVAPSYASFIALANGEAVDWQAARFAGAAPDVTEILTAAQALARHPVTLVTIDMPVATVPITGRREADDQISREFGARWCSAHTPSVERPGPMGETLCQDLGAAGYPLRANGAIVGSHLIEVYPHPALLSLLNRPQRVPYKVSKSNTYWRETTVATRIERLLNEFTAIYEAITDAFGELPFQLPPVENVQTLSSLKRYEDALDGLICAWVGIQHLGGTTVPLGNDTAAIWCPRDVVFGQDE